MKLKIIGPVLVILGVLFGCCTVIAMASGSPQQHTLDFEVKRADTGLWVELPEGPIDVRNLAPAETENTYLILHNEGDYRLRCSLDIERVGGVLGFYRGQTGADLGEVLVMTIIRDGEVPYEVPLNEFEKLGLGLLAAGEQLRLDLKVHLPGSAGNEYQGASVSVKFVVHGVALPGNANTGLTQGR